MEENTEHRKQNQGFLQERKEEAEGSPAAGASTALRLFSPPPWSILII